MYRVLIAEDEEIIRRGVCNSLSWEEIGCEIVGAVENGAEAIELLKQASPDLLLCDIRMPEVSGLDVARFICENKIDCKVIPMCLETEGSDVKNICNNPCNLIFIREIHILRQKEK